MAKLCSEPGCNNFSRNVGRRKDGTIKYGKHCSYHNTIKYDLGGRSYLKNRKDYCENMDSRLGYKCTTTITGLHMLHVDHIDSNHFNNNSNNHQTLCACCHAEKTHQDYLKRNNLKERRYDLVC